MGHRFHWICTVEGCGKPHLARGFCNAHYKAFRASGGETLERRPTPVMDFLETVAIGFSGDDCLFWPFDQSTAGYAHVRVGGRVEIASRYVCKRVNGRPPSRKYQAAHSCGNGHLGCVNPRHLSWKTPTDNAADKKLHGTYYVGEQTSAAKLTESQVREIRELRGKESRDVIAKKFGITPSHVSCVQLGRSWGHVELQQSGGSNAL